MTTAYFSHRIRGRAGEQATEAKQTHNIELAMQKAMKIRQLFPDLQLFVPHESKILNQMCFDDEVSGDALVKIECALIKAGLFQVLIVCGDFHEGGGVAMEIWAAHDSGVPVIFIDDVDDDSMQCLAEGLSAIEV